MCRLYGLHATHPTQPACDLLDAQNSLIQQSRRDERGLSNPHGWGVGLVASGTVRCERQVGPASESEAFREKVLRAKGTTVLAHVRRATIGTPSTENTHPFRDGSAFLIHNGHIEAFETVQERILNELPEKRERLLRGDTDSEHFFHLLQARKHQHPDQPRREIIRSAIRDVRAWSAAEDPAAEVALNVLWSDGDRVAGSRLNRSLWYRERDHPFVCAICGSQHAEPPAHEPYHTYVIASERITDEEWTEIPDESVFEITGRMELEIESI